MAQRVVFVDDIDGTEGAETVRYSVDGHDYEIDLSEGNAQKFRAALTPYLEKSRTVERAASSGRTRGRRATGSGRSKEELGAIRAWAESNRMDVSPRGRIKSEVIEAYDKAHA
jgi:hypothetical protein